MKDHAVVIDIDCGVAHVSLEARAASIIYLFSYRIKIVFRIGCNLNEIVSVVIGIFLLSADNHDKLFACVFVIQEVACYNGFNPDI